MAQQSDNNRIRSMAAFITKGPRLRTRAFIPFAVLLGFLAARTSLNYWGFAFISSGILIRLWAAGHLHKGGGQVTSSGPYAFCRNPLYLGSALLALGYSVLVHSYILSGLVVILFVMFHLITISYEESRLQIRYGEAYIEYCRHVPRLLPSPIPWKEAQKEAFSLARVRANSEHHRATYFVVFSLIIVLISYIF